MSSEENQQIKRPKGRPRKPDDEKITDFKAYKKIHYETHYKQNHPLPRGQPPKTPEAPLTYDMKLYHRARRERTKRQQLENNN